VTAIARIVSRVSHTDVDAETVKMILMICGAGLSVSLILATYGLDLSPGLF
jgi:hypothetical protein